MIDLVKKEEELARRAQILSFEDVLRQCEGAVEGDNEHCPLLHEFPHGLYVRTIFIPAGTVLTGKLHRHPHPNLLHEGIVEVVTEEGGTEFLEGPCFMISAGLTKRALVAHTDVIWTTIHPNPGNLQDPAGLEKEIIISDLTNYKKEASCHLQQ
jgi:hypothetical protein